ncbi:MAG: cyclic nucleotide-binding domain-containing protein, partial [Magnetococcales bacterium]|nr:cyclic nucleotide-binding domain-containing protein [Magnetococcales bacterium]
ALYWSVTTLTTVGYGDITPSSIGGQIYTMIIMLVGVGMYGLVIGNISSVMANANAIKDQHQKKVVALAQFLEQYQIPKHLQSDIFSFYRHYLFEKGAAMSDIVDELPNELQKDTMIYVHMFMLRSCPFFQYASDTLVREMVHCLTSRILSPGDIVIEAGRTGERMYFLSHGLVEVVTPDGHPLARLKTGSFFGEVALLRDVKRTATIRAITYCDIYVLGKDDFNHVMQTHPDFKEQLNRLMEERYS